MVVEEVDESCIAIMYNREKKTLLDNMGRLADNLHSIGDARFERECGADIDQFIREQTAKSLRVLKAEYYPVLAKPNIESNHVWVGVNPPHKQYTLNELYLHTVKLCSRYKWLARHAFTVESHTDGGYRPHVHLMAVTNQKKGRIIQQLQNFYDVKNNCIDVTTHYKGVMYGEHLDYILGNKKKDKNENRDKDILEKIELEIPQYINNLGED